MNAVFGPVHSWRLGNTLGVDMVASDRKYCSYDCVYCPQVGRNRGVTRRRWFVGMSALQALLESESHDADYVTFTGRGEPTLANNLSQAIDLVRSLLGLPVAVLTNSSLVPMDDVKRDLAKADIVVAKIDAPDQELFQAINRPFVRYTLHQILDALYDFRRSFAGKFVVQTTIVEANRVATHELADIARGLAPDEVQLNLRLQGWSASALAAEAERIGRSFAGLNVTSPHAGVPSSERVLDTSQLQRAGRHSAEVMLMAAAVA